MIVADNGRGIPEAKRGVFSETLGVSTVSSIDVGYDAGTRWTIIIDNPMTP